MKILPVENIFDYIEKEKRLDLFKKLLQESERLDLANVKNEKNNSIIEWSIINNKPLLLLVFLNKFAKKIIMREDILDFLIKNTKNDNEIMFDILLKYGANKNFINVRKRSLLHTIISKNQPANLEKLLKSGADVNVLDHNGYSPLSNALYYKKDKMIDLLLQYKIKNHLNKEGKDLYMLAIRYYSKYVLTMLENNIDVIPLKYENYDNLLHYCNVYYPKALVKLIQSLTLSELNSKSKNEKEYLIHSLCAYRRYDAIKEMFKRKVDINVLNKNNENILHCFVRNEDKWSAKTREVLILMLEHNIPWNNKNIFGQLTIDIIQNTKVKSFLFNYEKDKLKKAIPDFEKIKKINRI